MNQEANILNDKGQSVTLNTSPGKQYAGSTRLWQGVPGIERSANGRLWVTFYSGGADEGPDNYVLLISSNDDGQSWSEPLLVIDPPDQVRAYDPCLWHDPQGRLWLFWAQSDGLFDGRCGVWAINCADSAVIHPHWSAPRRIANGIMMNKPTVLTTGEWLLPAAVWSSDEAAAFLNETNRYATLEERFSNVYRSKDQGETFVLLGSADVPDRSFDEHMVMERKDGSLQMYVRLFGGIGESVSYDRGVTWSPGKKSEIAGPNSRFFIRKLQSGNWLLVNHYQFTGRNNLMAMISTDEGASWKGGLLLDDRHDVSYPDGVQADDGTIYIIYDRQRIREREILLAVFTEEDVINGSCVSSKAKLRIIVDKA